ncbi:MAG: winged helix-turn-helix transcriptional regulator [Ktedonobacteraceae bacterium]|nr:winged helix-turn-helix transcriptional regulator [Ktedonobacteraceae bacterium]MBO0795913.1 winged helix-turn-helix transcriptional regulator [Ktedonobacteraceae bacterium]
MATRVYSATALKAKLFRGFSDMSRLSILETLQEGPLTVGAIVERTGLSQPNVSNHLRCLSDCGLVVSQPQGRSTLYQYSDPRVGSLLTFADELLRDVARGVYECTRYEPSVAGKEPC